MRTITNRADLPIPMYNALAADTYIGGGDISATRLISPPRIVALRKYHEDEIKEDASDRVWSLLGSSVHRMLELSKGEGDDLTVETRLKMPVQGIDVNDDTWRWIVTAQPDVYSARAISLWDYKVTSVYSVLFGSKPEWEKQVNIQAALHRHNGDKVERGYIVAIMRDWQKRKALYEKNYPREAVVQISLPIWTQEEAIDYIRKRVRLHQKYQLAYEQSKDVESLPLCTDEERWYRGHKFAVKKMDKTGKINKKADRVFTTKTDALQYMTDHAISLPKGKSYAPVEERPGENIRCMSYCDVWFKCGFGRQIREEAARKAMATQDPLVNEEEED